MVLGRKLWLLGFMVCCGAALSGSDEARADFVLKPSGQNAVPLRRKALDVDVTLRGGIASSVETMTFANETSERTEADFILTIPPGAVVSGFAYWYGDEKVVARVVEKERAALIYSYITTRMRDPALVEMIGKNTFRARIFPVMPNADLKVEIRTIQPLSSTRNGLMWSLPLKPQVVGTGVLEALNVRVKIADESDTKKIGNNYGMSAQNEKGAQTLNFSRRDYQPDRDLNVSLLQATRTLSSSVYAARSSGSDGFFVVRLSTRETLRRPRFQVAGAVYDVVSDAPRVWKAGENWIVCGRYKETGTAQIIVAGQAANGATRRWKLPIALNAARESNNAATKLWAWARIAQLSASAKNRVQVVALSTRYALPSKYTSWLAIPHEERVRYQTEKAQADLEAAANALVGKIAAGKGESRVARKLVARFESLRQQAPDEGNTLSKCLNMALEKRYQTRMEMQYSKSSKPQEMRQLQREIGFLRAEVKRHGGRDDVGAYYRGRFEKENAVNEAQIVGRAIASETEAGGSDKRVAFLRARLQKLSENYAIDLSYMAQQAMEERLSQTVTELVAQKYAARKNKSRLKRLQNKVNRLALASNSDAAAVLKSAENARNMARIDVLAGRLANEIAAGREGEKANRVLDKQLDVVVARTKFLKVDILNSVLGERFRALKQHAAAEKYKRNFDAKKIADLNLRIIRLEKASGGDPRQDTYVAQSELVKALQADRDDYLREMQNPKRDARQLAAIEAHITRLYTDPNYVAPVDGAWWANGSQSSLPKDKPPFEQSKFQEIRGVYERARREESGADMKPLSADERASLAFEKAEAFRKLQYATRYFLRLGDPLISLDAPQNAQSVVAVMPDGSVKRLLWNAASRKWQARFDIPSYARPGEYSISLIVVLRNGARSETTMRYNVDMTAPEGRAHAKIIPSASIAVPQTNVRLEIETSDQTARVVALLPWGERIELKLSATDKNRFFALATPPSSWTKKVEVDDETAKNAASSVTYIITDKAHNRTTISVDMTK